jgi:hypothetical protein
LSREAERAELIARVKVIGGNDIKASTGDCWTSVSLGRRLRVRNNLNIVTGTIRTECVTNGSGAMRNP